jgi:hypothetical protein
MLQGGRENIRYFLLRQLQFPVVGAKFARKNDTRKRAEKNRKDRRSRVIDGSMAFDEQAPSHSRDSFL